MPRTKLQMEVEESKYKYPDFESLPNMITPTVLANSYFDISRPTAQRLIESIPGNLRIGIKRVIAKSILGRYTGEIGGI